MIVSIKPLLITKLCHSRDIGLTNLYKSLIIYKNFWLVLENIFLD